MDDTDLYGFHIVFVKLTRVSTPAGNLMIFIIY